VALQPLAGHKAAVVTVLIRLPSGDEEYALPEQCGIAIGSALITVGTSAYINYYCTLCVVGFISILMHNQVSSLSTEHSFRTSYSVLLCYW
jgi:hypothetical protein